jgi:hypothetical protein
VNFRHSINRRTPGRFLLVAVTNGMVPSLHIDQKESRIKQHRKI